MDASELRKLVRRVARRVIADRGNVMFERERGRGVTTPGINVTVGPAGQVGARPGEHLPDAPGTRREPGRGTRPLIDVEALDGIGPGGRLRVPPGAIVTALAEEEAQRRGVSLVRAAAGVLVGDSRSVLGARATSLAIGVGCDHGGFRLKGAVLEWLAELGHLGIDFGTRDETAVDYPDFARAVAEAVAQGRVDFGIVIDGAGLGSTMAANKVPGVRAANCWNQKTAANAREHNYANLLALGSGVVDEVTAREVVRTFLSTPEGPARHARRVNKITEIERKYSGGTCVCAGAGCASCREKR